MVTRAEYLAGSLSRRKPWAAEGIGRRQWERRRRNIAAATSAPAASSPAITSAPTKGARAPRLLELTADVASPASKAPRATLVPADDIIPVPAGKRILLRQAEDLLIRRIHDYWDAQGMTYSDPQALTKAINAITLPELFKDMDGRALGKVYRRARERLPVGYDRWGSLIEKWDKSYDRRKARDLVDSLVTAFGDRLSGFLDQMFDHLEQQICDHLPKKVRRLEYECERLKGNKYYIPQLRPLKKDALKEQVYAALAAGPKTKKELARMFRKPYGAISSVGLRLRRERLIKTIYRGGQFMWTRDSTALLFIPARDAVVAALQKKGPMTVPVLAQETGKATSTIKCALHRHLLLNDTVIRTEFGTYALADSTESRYVSKAEAIVATLKKGPMSFQALARETCTTPQSLPQFLELLLDKKKITRTERGIYALRGSAPTYLRTDDAIISALTKKPKKLGLLIQTVQKLARTPRSRSSIRTVLVRLTRDGLVDQDQRWGEYRLARRVRPGRREESARP